MLYCPKCRRTYENGTQRFCDNDGGRLLPAPPAQNADPQTGGVFSSLLNKTLPTAESDHKNGGASRFMPLNQTEESDKKLTSFPSAGRIFQSEHFLKPKRTEPETDEPLLELAPLPEKEEKPLLEFEPIPKNEQTEAPDIRAETPKPPPRLIRPNEIASGTADIGNRRTNPLGRQALSWENPEALLGQTVKGRYQIIEELKEDDEDSLLYLAEDRIVAGKKVVVRVFMNDLPSDDYEEKIFAEERVSLSHLNHPNIASVFDSGELQEGNTFIVSEFVEGEPIAEILRHAGQFNALRTARIIRQTSYALSEAHQNGILHRSLKPENIVLTVFETGIEQVKLMNFGVSRGEITDANFHYKAPEEIEKGNSTYASDIYALAVIAHEMLTARLPFNEKTESAQVRAQKSGLKLLPTSLRLDLPPLADKILQKALSFNPSDRYPKARDFGDAFFNALTTEATWSNDDSAADAVEVEEVETRREFYIVPPVAAKAAAVEENSAVEADLHIASVEDEPATAETAEVKSNEPASWEKRSPEPPKRVNLMLGAVGLLAVALVLFGLWGFSRWGISRRNANQVTNQPENVLTSTNQTENRAVQTPGNLPPIEADMPPQPRLQTTPPDTQRFQNTRESLKGELAKNFLGFEIFYPLDWKKNESATNFLDISKIDEGGSLIEQMLVTRYKSKGTMTLDKADFPKLAEKSNQDLKADLGENFRVISEGETTIQNGRWKVYEVKFQSSGVNKKGENITLWGRRLWLPVQSAGEQNGFVITLLATSHSDEVKSVNEVGVRGELAEVLETFEPEPK